MFVGVTETKKAENNGQEMWEECRQRHPQTFLCHLCMTDRLTAVPFALQDAALGPVIALE